LMDEQDAADTMVLQRILDSHVGPSAAEPRICSYHKLRHRHSGSLHWVDFHIQVPAGWAVERGHQVATAIEMEIERSLIQSSATAHVEPCIDAHCPGCAPP
jgi:divalent metal cation (Fe/Co/Zn/Cd) transporter